MEKLNVPQNLYKQFLCGKYCDLQIQVENSYFRAHSCVIAASSWVLEAILQSSTQAEDVNLSQLSIQLHDVTAYAISSLLGFIYTGKLPSETYVNNEKRMEVVHAAKLYEMEEVPNEFKLASLTSDVAYRLQGLIKDGVPKVPNLDEASSTTSLTGQNHIEEGINVVVTDDQFDDKDADDLDSEVKKLADDAVKDHVTKIVAYAKKHRILYCVFCSEVFSTQTDLIEHMSEHSLENQKFLKKPSILLIDDCIHDFTDELECDSSPPPNKCSTNRRKAFTCTECAISFPIKTGLINHINLIHPGSLYCKYCTTSFGSAELLQIHLASHNSEILHQDIEASAKTKDGNAKKTRRRKIYNCRFCHMSFLRCRELAKHGENVHGLVKPMHRCTTCGKEFKEKWGLRVHIRTHTGEKPYVCSHCGNRFADAKTWKDHERRHRGEKPFACSTCGKSFTYRQSFTRHMKFHEGKRPYQCSFCGKSFVLRHNLRDHEKRHRK